MVGVGLWDWRRMMNMQTDNYAANAYSRTEAKTYHSNKKNYNPAKHPRGKATTETIYPIPANLSWLNVFCKS